MNVRIEKILTMLALLIVPVMGDEDSSSKVSKGQKKAEVSVKASGIEVFRYFHQEVTGVTNVVIAKDGKKTLIKISDESSVEALSILDALLSNGLMGTSKTEKIYGVLYDQQIIFKGEFISEVKYTESNPNTAPSEPYRDFKISDVQLVFPFFRFVEAPKGDKISGPFLIEAHLVPETLFPEGIRCGEKFVDLKKHYVKPPDSGGSFIELLERE